MLKEIYATFVLPALGGCNLNCAYCVIDHRLEAQESVLSDEDYIRFFTDMLTKLKVRKFSIQGYEPLLPDTWPLTKELLRIAGALFCESAIITNGTYLAEHAKELGRGPGLVDSITVSLDGDRAEVHDKLRRKAGCFEAALDGIRATTREFHGTLMVNSVLFPGKTEYLAAMPELLAKLSAREWAISPYIQVGKESKVPNQEQLKESMLQLSEKAKRFGIKVYLADELRRMEGSDLFKDFYVRGLGIDEEIFRLSPDGSCSRGREILETAAGAPIWDRIEDPADFLVRIFKETGNSVRFRHMFLQQVRREHIQRFLQKQKGGD